MSMLKKDHILGAGSAALGTCVLGAAIGWFIGGIPAMTLGAVIGGALGAVIGHRLSEATDPRGDLGHFEQVYRTTPYYVAGMRWDDYAPAYRYGLETYRTHGGQPFEQAAQRLAQDWPQQRGISRLDWQQAEPAVAHAWRELDDHLRAKGRGG